MNSLNATLAFAAAVGIAVAPGIEAQTQPVPATAPKAPLTKEEKLAKIDAEIKRLQERRFNIENDIVTVARSKPVVALPNVGDEILFSYGRKTLKTNPVLREGVVAAIKPATVGENGKTLPAQIKVQCGSGFAAEFVVIYAGSIVPKGTTQADVDSAEVEDADDQS